MPAVVATSGAGNFAIANANVRSGSRTMPVPSAMTAKPSQIQFTSGLIDDFEARRLVRDLEVVHVQVQVFVELPADGDFGRRLFMLVEEPSRRIHLRDFACRLRTR